MREYQIGDDLRRIHWPSVARRNRLMIRQDEASKRGVAALFLDTRAGALGLSGEAGFERAVAAAASVGVLLSRSGFTVRLATAEAKPVPMQEEALLERLSAVSHVHSSSLAQSLVALRPLAGGDATLVAVTAPPGPKELASLTRIGSRSSASPAVPTSRSWSTRWSPRRSRQRARGSSRVRRRWRDSRCFGPVGRSW